VTHFGRTSTSSGKPDLSPVTIADRAIEQELRRIDFEAIPRAWHPRRGNGINSGQSLYLVSRPIDGTKSFISGMPLFGTLIALSDERNGAVIAG